MGASPLLKVRSLHVPRHLRQLDDQPVQLFGHLHLAAEPRRLGEAKRQVQHVVLVVARLGDLIVHFVRLDYYVAGRTRAGAAAGT